MDHLVVRVMRNVKIIQSPILLKYRYRTIRVREKAHAHKSILKKHLKLNERKISIFVMNDEPNY